MRIGLSLQKQLKTSLSNSRKKRPTILLIAFVFAGVLGVALPSQAQVTVTVTPGNTHQTWRFYGANAPFRNNYNDNLGICALLSASQFNTILGYVNDAGVNQVRVELKPKENIELADDAGFVYTNTYNPGGSTCINSFQTDITGAATWRSSAIAAGIKPIVDVTFITFPSTTCSPCSGANATPAWWMNGEGTHSGPFEGTEAYQATVDYIYNTFGFCPDFVKWNEPDNPNQAGWAYSNVGGATSWLPVTVNQFTSTIASDTHCSSVRFMGPEEENGNNVLSDLATHYGAVSGSEANLAWITYHSYPLPSDSGAAIYSHASAEGKQVAMTETYIGNALTDYNTALSEMTAYFLPEINIGNLSGWEWLRMFGPCDDTGVTNTGCVPSSPDAGGGIGIALEPDGSGTFYLQPLYYVFRQFSKYIQPGYVRVSASTTSTSVPVTAWKRADGSLVVLVVNNTGSTQSVTVNGLNNTVYAVHKLDATKCTTTGQFRCTPDDSSTQSPTNGSLSLPMPPGAVWTLAEGNSAGVVVPPSNLFVTVK